MPSGGRTDKIPALSLVEQAKVEDCEISKMSNYEEVTEVVVELMESGHGAQVHSKEDILRP